MTKSTRKVRPRRPEDVTFDQLSAMSLIADRSPAGTAAIKRWSDRFSDFASELTKWRNGNAQFIADLRTVNGASVLTLTAESLEQAEAELVPKLADEITAIGGLCGNILGVSSENRPALERKLAEYPG
jgi:hypothetical protein